MTFLLRLSLAADSRGLEIRANGRTDIKIADLLEMGNGKNAWFWWNSWGSFMGFEEIRGLWKVIFCKEAMATLKRQEPKSCKAIHFTCTKFTS